MRLIAFILLFLQVSCGAMRSGIKVEMTFDDRVQTENAIELANVEYGKNILQLIDANHYIVIYKVPNESLESHIAGVAYVGGLRCKIAIPERTFDSGTEFLTTVIWHEIGHCYKLPHVTNPFDIMYTSVRNITTYSTEVKQQFLRRLYEASH